MIIFSHCPPRWAVPIAVIRASGSGVLPVLREIFSGRIEHRQLNYGKIIDRIEPDGGQGEERKENDHGCLGRA